MQRAPKYSIIRQYAPATGLGQPPAQITVPDGCNRCAIVANVAGAGTSQVVRPLWQDVDDGTGITVSAHLGAAVTVTDTVHGWWTGLDLPRGRGTVSAELGTTVGAPLVDVIVEFWSEG